MEIDPDEQRRAARALATARRVVFFTGAGMSAESGVPTFRGPGGLWEGHRPEELATPGAFARDPELVVDWYRWRRDLVASVEPHAGYRAIADYQRSRPDAVVITQNVDGLHQRSGGRSVAELHGSLWIDRCADCGAESRVPPEGPRAQRGDALERCDCGGLLRPGVVWFGEGLLAAPWESAVRAISGSDVIVVVGTSAVVQPAASLAEAAGPDALRIEVNPSPALDGGLRLAGTAAGVLPAILRD